MFARDLLLIDYETTGTSVLAGHEPVQVGAVRLDRETLDEKAAFASLVRPLAPERADPVAMAIHRIPMSRLVDAPLAADVVRAFELALLGAAERARPARTVFLAAHNATFDRAFHELLLERAGLDRDRHGHRWFDTWTAALALGDVLALELPASGSLDALCRFFGILRPEPHDALADARATAAMLRALRAMSRLATPSLVEERVVVAASFTRAEPSYASSGRGPLWRIVQLWTRLFQRSQ